MPKIPKTVHNPNARHSQRARMPESEVHRFAIYDGSLIAGDPISNNVYVLFSGFDDDESPIENYWQDGPLNLGTENLKVAHHMRVQGLIQPTKTSRSTRCSTTER